MKTKLNEQAIQLNEQIGADCPAVLEMLSKKGRAIYFPKLGILAQSAEANGKEINATIGIALEEDGAPMILPSIAANCTLKAGELVSYAPSPGRPDIRKIWKEKLLKNNPSLAGKSFSLPVVTSALTHGLSMSAYLFCDEGDPFIVPDLYWENYDLIFANGFGARLIPYPLFDGGGFNLAGLKKQLLTKEKSKKIVCLNFPNNPTGYTPTTDEAAAIAALLLEAAQAGNRIVVLVDDAYFGLVFEKNIFRESLFSSLCDLHPNILAVKLDGPTKEDYVWGFRVGFITYGIKGGTPAVYSALEAKTAGAIRGNISNSANISQSILLKAYGAQTYESEKRQKYEILNARYQAVKRILAEHPEYRKHFEPLPFNSGYFMCLKMISVDPEDMRRKLLRNYSSGVIVMNNLVRIAFSSTPLAKLPKLFENIYCAANELMKN
ncbi:MAG: aminotransferase class I/II-fold pyridoxal phosphate-dependent enzyme [Kiritimatiellia bacterium]|nr:aminotransferase class I/II-fold pyridoxal phosphate-dependent enzyme [Kiritimatiellia bacterium]